MYQLVKWCYSYGILIVHLIETKVVLMLLSKNTLRQYFNKCYVVSNLHVVQLTIKAMLLLSKMYHDIFTIQKKNGIEKKLEDKLKTHTYYSLRFHTFLVQQVSLSLVLVMILNNVPSLLCFHIIKTVDILKYAFCLYTLMCLQLIFYLMHIKGINWQDSWSNDWYGIMVESNISYISPYWQN